MNYLPWIVLAAGVLAAAWSYRAEAHRKRKAQAMMDRLKWDDRFIYQEDGKPLMRRGTEVD